MKRGRACRAEAAKLRRWMLALMLAVLAPARLPAQQPLDVFRVTTELVQTDVVVVDRQGYFVDGLQREQFELRVDGKPQAISFFERVQTGSASEGAQIAAARGGAAPALSPGDPAAVPVDRGRTVLFFIDDVHLAFDSLKRAAGVVTDFIEHQMGQRDQVAIASTSGQLGFLQQLTGNKTMLRAAVARLNNRARTVIDVDRPAMSVFQAHVLDRGADRELFDFYVKEAMRQNFMLKRPAAEALVSARARQMVAQSADITQRSLVALEAFVRSRADLPGRKLAFFLSDGFEIDFRYSDTSERLRQIAGTAMRAGVVLYTMDTRGLATLPSFDASRPSVVDPTAVFERSQTGELSAAQEPLYALAADTGGRALFNTNALTGFVPQVLQETSRYYLLAWTPEQDGQPKQTFHPIQLTVTGRPELTVRVARGFYDAPAPAAQPAASSSRRRDAPATPAATATENADAALLSALHAAYPVTALPARLSLGFTEIPNRGTVVTASTHLAATPSAVDVVYAVFDDQGKGVLSLKERVTAGNATMPAHQFQLKPGLYQVRVAARDSETGRLGSAMDWIDVPKLAGGPFTMSSLAVQRNAGRLQFLAYLYNAARTKASPDVVLKVQVLRDEKAVVSAPVSRLKTDGAADLSRIPYSAELNLEGLPGGSYVLQVTATDRTAGTTASRRMEFEID